MNKKCIGCGSILQSINIRDEGFVKSSVIDTADYCERCFKIKHYGEYSVLDKKIDYQGLIRNINSDENASIVFLIDILNINDNIKSYINKFKCRKYILITKKDILPKSLKDKKIIEYVKKNIINIEDVMYISSKKNYNIDLFLQKIENDSVRRLYIVGFTNSGKSTFINHILSSKGISPVVTTSAIPNTTASYITIKINKKLTFVDTPGFIDKNAIYNFIDFNKLIKLYPKKEIKVKTYQLKPNYSIIINDILRIDNIGLKTTSLSFYMNDKLRYEKIKIKNDKLMMLPSKKLEIIGLTDILINGLGFIRVTKDSNFNMYTLNLDLIETRKSMI